MDDVDVDPNVVRTPDEHFKDLPGWPHEPSYFTSRLYGLSVRMAYYAAGPSDARETVLLVHGMHTWAYLNRRLVQPLVDAGHRVVMFDQVGCGRSDKPRRESDYSYERHCGWNADLLIHHLRLSGVTALFQDWGGLIGLRVASRYPSAFRRLLITNTMLPTCDDAFFRVTDAFYEWKRFSHRSQLREDVWVREKGGRWPGAILAKKGVGPSNTAMSAAEEAAYNAPYPAPTELYAAGARMFPELIPTPRADPTGRPQAAGGEENAAAWAVYKQWRAPVLLAFSDEDTVMAGGDRVWLEHCPGTRYPGVRHVTVRGVGHFVQDGGAEQLVQALLGLIDATPADRIPRFGQPATAAAGEAGAAV
eukprot:g972.t1